MLIDFPLNMQAKQSFVLLEKNKGENNTILFYFYFALYQFTW